MYVYIHTHKHYLNVHVYICAYTWEKQRTTPSQPSRAYTLADTKHKGNGRWFQNS